MGPGIWDGGGRTALRWGQEEGAGVGSHRPVWDPAGVRGLGDVQAEVPEGLRGKAGAGDRRQAS